MFERKGAQLLAVVGLGLVGLAWAAPGLAETCRYHNLQFDLGAIETIEPLDDYDHCQAVPVHGTLEGRYVSCVYLADAFPSHSLWGDGNFETWVLKWSSVFETSNGEVSTEERETYSFTYSVSSSLFEVTGGNGDFAGATGVMQSRMKWPNRLDALRVEGRICTP